MNFSFRRPILNASPLLARVVLGMLLLSASAHATALFRVTVNTSSLIGSSSAPFALDFQFNNGSILNNNTVTSFADIKGAGVLGVIHKATQ